MWKKWLAECLRKENGTRLVVVLGLAGMVCILLLIAVQAVGGFLIDSITTFMAIFMLHECTIMSFNTLMASYPQRLFPRAYFAQFNSAMMMVQSISTVLLAPLFGWILDMLNSQYRFIFPIGCVLGICV